MLIEEVREYIIRPAFEKTQMWSKSAEVLVVGTGLVESGYEHVMQIGLPQNGGIGFFQMEPSDFRDVSLWLRNGFNKGMLERVLETCYYQTIPSDPLVLSSNIQFAALMCRVHYHRIKEKLPEWDDAKGMAHYHMKYYNGDGIGKTGEIENVSSFQRVIDDSDFK